METKSKKRTTLIQQVKKAGKLLDNLVTKTFVYDHSAKRYLIDFHNEFIDKWSAQLNRNKNRNLKKVTPAQHKRIVNSLIKKYSSKIDQSYQKIAEWNRIGSAAPHNSRIKIDYKGDKKSK